MTAQHDRLRHGPAATWLSGRSAIVAAMRAGQSGLMLLALALAARWLGAGAYGAFATVMACAGMLAVLAQLGLPQHLLRRVGALEHDGAFGGLRALLCRSIAAVGAAGAGMATLAALASWTGVSIGLPKIGRAHV